MVAKRRHLKVVRTFVVNAEFVKPGAIVEAGLWDADNLVARKVAVQATDAEVSAAGVNIIVAPADLGEFKDKP